MIYKIKVVDNGMIYVVDTDLNMYWPEGRPDMCLNLFDRLNPELSEFHGIVLHSTPILRFEVNNGN
jgi:hypothetical protein